MAEEPRIYDVATDETRPVTQTDIAIFEATAAAYGRLRKMIETEHARLLAEVAGIRSRAGLSRMTDAQAEALTSQPDFGKHLHGGN